MNLDEYLQAMKQAIDESVQDDEKIQEFLVWLHEKTASLGSSYQESAVRAFYCNLIEDKDSVNRETSRILDNNLDEGLDKVRGLAIELDHLLDNMLFPSSSLGDFRRIFYSHSSRQSRFLISQIEAFSTTDIVIDRHFAIVYNKADRQNAIPIPENSYLPIAVSLLVRSSDRAFRNEVSSLVENSIRFRSYRHKRMENERKRLAKLLEQYRNLKLDWQFNDEQRQLLNQYYSANKLLVDCLQDNNPTPGVRKEIQDALLLPIVEIERRKLNAVKQLTVNDTLGINSNLEVQEIQEILLPIIEVQNHESNVSDASLIGSLQENSSDSEAQEVQESALPNIEAERSDDKKEESYSASTKTNFYGIIFLCSMLAIALSIASAILLKNYS